MQSTKKLAVLVGMVASQGCLSHLYPIHKCRQLLVPTAVLHGIIFCVALEYKKGLCCCARYIEQSLQAIIFFQNPQSLGLLFHRE